MHKVRNCGEFKQCVITCMLQGIQWKMGIPYTFYEENICSVYTVIRALWCHTFKKVKVVEKRQIQLFAILERANVTVLR